MLTANNGLYMYQQFVPLWIYKTFFFVKTYSVLQKIGIFAHSNAALCRDMLMMKRYASLYLRT